MQMDEIIYEKYKTRAAELQTRPGLNRQVERFWSGYLDGLKRLHLGDRFGSELEHTRRMAIPEDHRDTAHRYRGIGYRAGYAGTNPDEVVLNIRKKGDRGNPRIERPKSAQVWVRLPEDTKQSWAALAENRGVPITTAMGECLEKEVSVRHGRLKRALIRMIRKGHELAYQNQDELLGRVLMKTEELIERIF
jgi:hypothetical protein